MHFAGAFVYNNNWHGFVTLNYPAGYRQASYIYRSVAGKYVVFSLTRKQSLLCYCVYIDSKHNVKMSVLFLGSIWYSKAPTWGCNQTWLPKPARIYCRWCLVLLRSAYPVPDGRLHIETFFFKIFCISFCFSIPVLQKHRGLRLGKVNTTVSLTSSSSSKFLVRVLGYLCFGKYWWISPNLLLTHSPELDSQLIVPRFQGVFTEVLTEFVIHMFKPQTPWRYIVDVKIDKVTGLKKPNKQTKKLANTCYQ